MPKIPGYRADLQREIRAPYETGDASPTKIRNQGLQSFAGGLQDFGQGMMRQEALDEAKRKESENIAIANFTTSAKGVSDALSYAAFEKANPDGSDLIKNYSEEYDKQMQGELKKITDPVAQQKAYGKLLEIKNDRLEKLRGDSDRMFKENANITYENQMKVGVSRVTANPTLIDKELDDYTQTLAKSGYSQTNKLKAFELGKKEMVTGALNGYINSGDYGAARAALDNKFVGVFDAEQTQKWIDKIDTKKIEELKTTIKAAENEEKNYAEAQSQRQNKNFTKLYGEITQMNEVDPYAPGKGLDTEKMTLKVDEMVASGELKIAEATHLKRFISKEQSEDSAEVSLSFYNKLASGENPDKIKEEILQASSARILSPQTAQSLLGRIEVEKEKTNAKARVGRAKKTDPLNVVANDLITSYFKPPPGLPVNLENKEKEVDAKAIYNKLRDSPKYKNDPVGAARASLKKAVPGYAPPVFKSSKEISESAQSLKRAVTKGQISDQEYKRKVTELLKKKKDFEAGGI